MQALESARLWELLTQWQCVTSQMTWIFGDLPHSAEKLYNSHISGVTYYWPVIAIMVHWWEDHLTCYCQSSCCWILVFLILPTHPEQHYGVGGSNGQTSVWFDVAFPPGHPVTTTENQNYRCTCTQIFSSHFTECIKRCFKLKPLSISEFVFYVLYKFHSQSND